jgi:hypothetical protein
MNKHCAICGRENEPEAFHCYACRSREFGNGSPSTDYLAAQKTNAQEPRTRLLQESIESYKSFPGSQHKLLLSAGSFIFVLMGFLAAPGLVSRILLGFGAVLLGWVVLTLRVNNWRKSLELRNSAGN